MGSIILSKWVELDTKEIYENISYFNFLGSRDLSLKCIYIYIYTYIPAVQITIINENIPS